MIRLLLLSVLVSGAAFPAADGHSERILKQVGFDQRIGHAVPLDLVFKRPSGAPVRLDQLIKQPTVLVFAWYECPTLCGMILHNLARQLAGLSFDTGEDYDIITVSIDPSEGPAAARRTRAELLSYYGAPEARGWYVLTGAQDAIRRLADAVGYHYTYDARTSQYAHPVGLIILDAEGRINRYLFGVQFARRDLRLALLETSRGQLGSPLDRFVLSCYRFNPQTGRYTLAVMQVVRVLGIGTVALLGGGIGVALLRERKQRRERSDGGT